MSTTFSSSGRACSYISDAVDLEVPVARRRCRRRTDWVVACGAAAAAVTAGALTARSFAVSQRPNDFSPPSPYSQLATTSRVGIDLEGIHTASSSGSSGLRAGAGAAAIGALAVIAHFRPSAPVKRSRFSKTDLALTATSNHSMMNDIADDLDELISLLSGTPVVKDSGEIGSTEVVAASIVNKESAASATAMTIAASTVASAPAAGKLSEEDEEKQVQLMQMGLQPAPEYGDGMFVASLAQIDQISELRMQKIQASLKALNRYVESLEQELDNKDDQLETAAMQLQQEKDQRMKAEQERDELLRQRVALEARLVEDTKEEWNAEKAVEEMDRQAEIVAEQLASGQLSEEEAAKAEEDLIRAQARFMAATETREKDATALVEVAGYADEASRRAKTAGEGENRINNQLLDMQRTIEEMKAQRDAEAKLRSDADERYQRLVGRIREKSGSG